MRCRAVRWPSLVWLPVLIAAPMLLFPGRLFPVGLAVLGLAWVARRVVTGRWSVPTAARRPIAVLLVMLVVALAPAPRLDFSLPKLTGIVLGVAVFYACVQSCRSVRAIERGALLVVALGVLAAIAGVLLIDRRALTDDRRLLAAIYHQFLPTISAPIQTSTVVTAGVNPNETGGVIALVLPVAVGLASLPGRVRWVAAASTVVLVVALALTESRASIVGVAVAAYLGVGCLVGRRARVALAVAGIAGAVLAAAALMLGLDHLGIADHSMRSLQVDRMHIWSLALSMLLDMPFTGVGLNNLSVVVDAHYGPDLLARYPTVGLHGEQIIPHAHNLALQTALDLGVVGLAAFCGIVVVAVREGLRAARTPQRALATGLLLGLVAHGVYSLVDAITLGAKPGVLLWAVLGLLTALGACAAPVAAPSVPSVPSVPSAPVAPSPGRRYTLASRVAARLRRPPVALRIGSLMVAVWLLLTPAILNGVMIVLHRPATATAAARGTTVDAALDMADRFAWGPYPARVQSARDLVARLRAGGSP